jgi:hypothetical protein
MGNRIVGFGVWCVLGLVGCSSERSLQENPSQRAELAVQQEELNLLCSSDQQCSDGHACTIDLCIAGICVHGPDLGCCESDDDCSTDLSCTAVSCVLNTCVESPILGCGDTEPASTTDSDTSDDLLGILCGSDTDCEDGDPCTDDVCLVGGVCLFASNPLCCDTADDCEGVLQCHTGQCVDNRCSLTVVPDCESDAGASGDTTSDPVSSGATDEPASSTSSSGDPTSGETAPTSQPDDAPSDTIAPAASSTGETTGTTFDDATSAETAPVSSATGETDGATIEASTDATFVDTSADSATVTDDDRGPTSNTNPTTKPTMGDPWNDSMPILTPFASGEESTETAPGTSGATVDAGAASTVGEDTVGEDTADYGDTDDDGADDNAADQQAAALMTSRMTGGACSVSKGSGETSQLAWILAAVTASLFGRRRK